MKASALTIEAIIVPPSTHPVHTETYLNALSDTEWSELRAKATRSRRTGQPALLCGDCGQSVYGRESSYGRRHCFHFGTETKDCRWASANASSFRSIDANKFQGQQEGARHKKLKAMICEILELDPDVAAAGIAPERYTKGHDGQYAFPDVYASNCYGGPTAFEIQLSTTQLPTITRREDFYCQNDIRLCWVTSGDRSQLDRRAFKDIYLRNDGQIFAVDDEVLAEARAANAPRLRLMRLLPGPLREGLRPNWRERIVTLKEIDWGQPGDRPRSKGDSFDAYLEKLVQRDPAVSHLRSEFYSALTECNQDRAGVSWDSLASIVGGASWSSLGDPYDTVRALGVLATVRRNELSVQTKIGMSNLHHLVNSLLLEPKERRSWSGALRSMSESRRPDLLAVPSVAKKIARNLENAHGNPGSELLAGRVFDVLFPEGAFQRLRLTEP
ncbi:MAG: DUF6035 family protein [Pseudomonadota bacterium]